MKKILQQMKSNLHAWWKKVSMDPDERYIAQSSNIVELENRIKQVIYRTHNSNNFNGVH